MKINNSTTITVKDIFDGYEDKGDDNGVVVNNDQMTLDKSKDNK